MTISSDAITVMIVDDHQMVRLGACSYLEAHPDISVVAQARSGEEAVNLAHEFIPDVVLMDLVMPGMDGVDATRKVKDISPRTQIIILTSFHQDEYIFPALQAGAISFFLKDVKATELVEAIRRAARREATLHPKIAARVIKTFRSLVVGAKKAREMWMLCRRYIAAQALEMGLVNSVVPDEKIWDEVDQWCEELLEKSPGCLEILKAAFDQEMDGYTEMGFLSSQHYPDWFDMPEGKEGGAAFTEKRKPGFWKIREAEAEARRKLVAEYEARAAAAAAEKK